MVAVNKKTAMLTMAALPLTISAVGVNFSSNLAPLYTPMTPSFNADGKYPCGSTTGTKEAPAMPATVNATKIGCVEMPVNTSALKVFNSANTKPICAHRPLINSAVGVHPDCLNKVSPYFSTNKASPKDVSVEPKISNAFVNSGMSISLTKPGIGDPPSAMSMMSSSSPKPSSPPDISWFICSALVCFGDIIIIISQHAFKRERKKMMSVKAERARERELKRLSARETERNHITCTVFLSNQNENETMTSRCLLCRRTGNKNAKRIIHILKRTTKVADLFEVVFVALKATMDVVNVVLAVVAENMIIFVVKV